MRVIATTIRGRRIALAADDDEGQHAAVDWVRPESTFRNVFTGW
jgi:hypothetical protein